MYLFLFLVALPGQFLFGVTTMTMSAVVTTYLFGLAYYAATGTYYFFDSYIPIAVFLGMHLLFTDPSTAPRTELGRMIFGALYGLSTIALYALLGVAGLPTFYDKLLQVPLLNLSIQGDRPGRPIRSAAAVRSGGNRAFTLRQPPQSGVHVRLGDRVRRHDRRAGRRRSPSRPVDSVLAAGLPAGSRRRLSSIWLSCTRSTAARAPAGRATSSACCRPTRRWIGRPRSRRCRRGCELGFQPACANATALTSGGPMSQRISAARGASNSLARKQRADHDRSSASLYARACDTGLARQLWSGSQLGRPVNSEVVPVSQLST